MNYFIHLLRNVKKKVPKDHKDYIIDHINDLSVSNSKEIFNIKWVLIKEEWEKLKIKEVDDFLEYFYKQYVMNNATWYLGHPEIPGVGNSNNCIEGFNCAFKKQFTEYTIQDIVII